MDKFRDVDPTELEQIAGGVGSLIAVGVMFGLAAAGAMVLGYAYGATSDECKK
jgi:lactobin A/cerein 7B family class IIb bacteriocin